MISAGVVPAGGGAVVDEAAGAEVEVVGRVVWVDVAVVVAAIRGSEGEITTSGEAKGVERIAWRRESSSGSRVLSESDSGGSEGDFGGSGTSGMGDSTRVSVCTSCSDMSGRSAPRCGKEFPAL